MSELGEQGRVLRNVFEADNDFGDPVEVPADADMVGPDDLSHVFDLIGNL